MQSPLTQSSVVDACPPDETELTYRKVFFRIMPFLILCYAISYFDRANISFAKLQFMSDLGFSEEAYGFGAGLFFIGYVVLEVPSNLLMQRIGARRTLLRIMVFWGVIASSMMFVSSPTQFYVMRFLLGAAEAGFFPGVMFYLTYWFPASRRGQAMGFFMMGAAGAGITGGPLATWIMVHSAEVYGLHGWQWLFLVEGIPAIIIGLFAFFYLSDKPQDAAWLTTREKAIIQSDLAAEESQATDGTEHGLLEALRNPKVYVGILVYFSLIASFNALSLWVPTVIHGVGINNLEEVGLLSSIIFTAGAAGTYLIGYSSDRKPERRWHFTVSCAVVALCFTLLPLAIHSVPAVITLLAIAAAASYGTISVFWTIPATFLPGKSKASGIALITSLGGLSAFVSPTLVGWIKTHTGSIYPGLITMGVITLLGAILLLVAIPAESSRTSAK